MGWTNIPKWTWRTIRCIVKIQFQHNKELISISIKKAGWKRNRAGQIIYLSLSRDTCNDTHGCSTTTVYCAFWWNMQCGWNFKVDYKNKKKSLRPNVFSKRKSINRKIFFKYTKLRKSRYFLVKIGNKKLFFNERTSLSVRNLASVVRTCLSTSFLVVNILLLFKHFNLIFGTLFVPPFTLSYFF